MARTITLFVPGFAACLAELRKAAIPRVPELEAFFARASKTQSVVSSADALAFELFGRHCEGRVPVGPVTYALDTGIAPVKYVMRADPVYIAPDRDVLRLLAHAELKIARDESRSIIDTLNQHFSADEFKFEAPQSHRWYLSIPTEPRVQFHPLASALGNSVDPVLPTGDDARRWHGYLNEIQMLLHSHPVNAEREARGELPLNSLWLWGGGQLTAAPPVAWAQVWSDDPVTLGLAKLAGVPRTGLVANARGWLDAAVTPGDHLISLSEATGSGAADVIVSLNERWVAPLCRALKAREISRITLVLDTGARLTAQGKVLERWWIRRRPLQ